MTNHRRSLLALLTLSVECSPAQGVPTDANDVVTTQQDTFAPRDVAPLGEDIPAVDVTPPVDATTDTHSDTDAADVQPTPVALPACLGTALPLTRSGGLPYASVTVGSAPARASGAFLLDLATTRSTIDLAAFPVPRPAATGCDASRSGQACAFNDFDFFGSWGNVTLFTADHAGVQGSVRQAGIVGTDFFAVHVFTLDYAGQRVMRAPQSDACADAALVSAGLVPLSTRGFYAHDRAQLRPLSDVDSTASAGTSVPNVPTVPLRVAGVTADAQLDTGFDDALVPHSINVNEAFLAALQLRTPGAVVRDATLDLALTTCVVGLSERVDAYRLATGRSAEFIAVDGSAARSVPDAVLFVKRTPSAARVCGGIGTWSVPAAQIAASFLIDGGVVVFDPFRAQVWVRPSAR